MKSTKIKKSTVPPKTSLVFLVSDSFNVKIDGEEFDHLYGYTLSYMTKGITAFEYQDLIKPYCEGRDFSAKVFRLRLHTSKYMSLTMKLFMMLLSSTRSVSLERVKSLTADLGIHIVDAKRMYALWTAQPKFRARLKADVHAIPEANKHLLDDKELTRYFESMYASVMKYVKYVTYSKLRFIAKSSNLDLADLHNELLSKVLQTYYTLVPIVLPEAHVVNYLKRAAHNHAINMIKMETTQKRGRLVNVGLDHEKNRVFSLRMVSENQMTLTPEMAELSYDEIHNDGSNSMAQFELEFSVAEILTKLQQRSKKYRLLKILMGTEDEQFTEWLRARGRCSAHHDNVDVQTKVSVKEFNCYLSEFLHVSEDRVNVFLFELRKDLAIDDKTCSTGAAEEIARKRA